MLFRVNAPINGDTESTAAIAKAFSTWMALQSIDPANRAKLGIDLTAAPQLEKRLIPLPDEEIFTIQTGSRATHYYEFVSKSKDREVIAKNLQDITGRNYTPTGHIDSMYNLRKILENDSTAIGHAAMLMVGDYNDPTSNNRVLDEDNVLLVQKNIAPMSSSRVDTVSERITPSTMAMRRIHVPATVSVETIAAPEADEEFIRFYTSEAVIKALKDNQDKMQMAKELLQAPLPARF